MKTMNNAANFVASIIGSCTIEGSTITTFEGVTIECQADRLVASYKGGTWTGNIHNAQEHGDHGLTYFRPHLERWLESVWKAVFG